MRYFLADEFRKFKIEVVELIQYVSKFKTLTMNIQTYLSINILVLLGIEANILHCPIEPSILRYALYIYFIFTVITMICRRLIDSNSSIFWLILLFVPFVNIYVLYLLYNKTSAVYDQESNSIFYYPL